MKKYIIGLSTLILFSGCGATGQQFVKFDTNINNDKGILYVYRPKRFMNSTVLFNVVDRTDKINIGTLRNGGYLKQELTAGDKNIIIDVKHSFMPITYIIDTSVDIPVTIKANEITCIRFNSKNDIEKGFIKAKDRIIPLAICEKEIKLTRKVINN